MRHRLADDDRAGTGRYLRLTGLVAALVLLNGSLAFENLWPTPMVRWSGALSIELALAILALGTVARWRDRWSSRAVRISAVVWLLLVAGHYADVTAPALYGREVNLYWDLRFVPDVAALLARGGPLRLALAVALGIAVMVGLLYVLFRWALGRVAGALAAPRERQLLTAVAAAIVVLFAVQKVTGGVPPGLSFAPPVTATYARQARLVARALTGSVRLPESPAFDSDFARVKGADVFLVFLESYGAVTFDRPELASRLAPARAVLDRAIHTTNRQVVSAFVESPTFGGSSWLAHISLLSGIEVRGPETNALLMTQKRETLVSAFAHHGYRTVALMPGLWQRWPEGAFYGFDDIYGGGRLDYRGPAFGWFDMTDQFALARLDALEPERAGRPLFVFFPTISTHTPFTPTPPYQPDWRRVLSDTPYDVEDLDNAYGQQPDWLNLGPAYGNAMAYAFTTLAGYLQARADRDLVIVLLGDHQPPALVSGAHASWDVPVHVITGRRAVVDRLRAVGFRSGLTPVRPILGRMHTLLPRLLDAFGDREPKG